MKGVKKITGVKDFYLPILNFLKTSNDLIQLRKDLNISKQNLNYYLYKLKKGGYIKKDKGFYQVVKNITNYDNLLKKDFIRGHAFVWEIKLPKEIEGWNKRIDKLKEKDINFNLVGALKDIPRIKVLGRKIWLCKDHIRIFDKADASYYGNDALESRRIALNEVLQIVSILENKLGIKLDSLDIVFKKEHYALIKNDLAIETNRKGEKIRVSDESGEWLLVDDSLEKGGELENVGNNSLKINIKMSKWWNEQKETNFEVTPKQILNYQLENTKQLNQLTSIMNDYGTHIKSHTESIKALSKAIPQLVKLLKDTQEKNNKLKQKRLFDF